jgi:hypothetical protein
MPECPNTENGGEVGFGKYKYFSTQGASRKVF